MVHFLVMTQSQESKIENILSRGVGEFIDPNNTFKDKLLKKIRGEYSRDIIIKFGVDPTRPDIHLGHAVILHKLRGLQDLGCKVVFLVGDFTASIGDPTGKSKTRPEIEQEEIEKNMKTYIDQVGKILRTEKEVFSWIRNSDWFVSPLDLQLPDTYKVTLNAKKDSEDISIPINPNSMEGKAIVFQETRMQKKDLHRDRIETVSLINLLWTLKHITYSQLIARDLFQERIKSGEHLYMHEVLYPVFQGIDSDVLAKIYGSCDLEIGGTDQTFNMLVGRDVMKTNKRDPQSVLSLKILEGTDGKEKMSKSLDNYITITSEPNDMYGKVMSVPDTSLVNYFRLCTYTPLDAIEEIELKLKKSAINPRDIKMRLAKEIVSIYHGEESSQKAEEAFVTTFQKGKLPEDIEEVTVSQGIKLGELLLEKEFVTSKTELRRLIQEGAVSDFETGEKIESIDFVIEKSINLKIGKKRFLKIVV